MTTVKKIDVAADEDVYSKTDGSGVVGLRGL